MYVGIFGDVIFSVGHLRVLTPSNFKGDVYKRQRLSCVML